MSKRAYRIPRAIAEPLFRRAMFIANHIHLDELRRDCARRITSSKGIGWAFTEILNSERPHLTCYERQSFGIDNPDYFEFSMSTMTSTEPEYILWVHVPIEPALELIDHYSLEPML